MTGIDTAPPRLRVVNPEAPDGLPDGFQIRPDGVYLEREREDGVIQRTRLCSPIVVLALSRDPRHEGWGRWVEVTDPDGGTHRLMIPAELFAGDGLELRRVVMRLGLVLESVPGARAALTDLLQRWRPAARAVTVARLGWVDETCSAFVLGDGRVIGGGTLVPTGDIAAPEMRAAGTPEAWRDGIAGPCIGNPLLLGAVSLAFAGPLLELLGLDGGGIHLRGASSRGKSTILRAAVSVWGAPKLLGSWRATANGLEGVACACNGTLLALDEMGEVSGRDAGAAAYMLANGAGKSRAHKSGSARPQARWKAMILSSGEISLADKIAEAGGRAAAGQEVRLLDIPADDRPHGAFDDLHGAADGAAFADALNRASATSFGTAGPAFVDALLANDDGCSAMIRGLMEAFHRAAQVRIRGAIDGQVARAIARLSLIAAAGEAATRFGLTGWPEGAAQDAALALLELWLQSRGGTGAAEARAAILRTREFVSAHGGSRFEAIGDEVGALIVGKRAGWRDGDRFYITIDAWKEIHAGADPTRAARHLLAAGLLEPGDRGHLQKKLPPKDVKERPRVYAVKREILGAGDDDV
jgi:putative DNA primase/helicase